MAVAMYERLVTEDLDRGTGAVTKRNPGGGSLVGTQVGIHSFAIGTGATSTTWDPGEVAAGSKVSTTVTVSGANLGDFVLASFSLDLQELVLSASISAANTVEVVLANLTGSAVDLSSGTLRVLVLQSR